MGRRGDPCRERGDKMDTDNRPTTMQSQEEFARVRCLIRVIKAVRDFESEFRTRKNPVLRRALHDFWEDRKDGPRRTAKTSKDAKEIELGRKDGKTTFDHAIPLSVVISELLSTNLDEEARVYDKIKETIHLRIISKEEDRILNRIGLNRQMPPEYDDPTSPLFRDVEARYKKASIEFVDEAEPTDAHHNRHASAGEPMDGTRIKFRQDLCESLFDNGFPNISLAADRNPVFKSVIKANGINFHFGANLNQQENYVWVYSYFSKKASYLKDRLRQKIDQDEVFRDIGCRVLERDKNHIYVQSTIYYSDNEPIPVERSADILVRLYNTIRNVI